MVCATIYMLITRPAEHTSHTPEFSRGYQLPTKQTLTVQSGYWRVGTDDCESPTEQFHLEWYWWLSITTKQISHSRVGIGGVDSPPDQTLNSRSSMVVINYLLNRLSQSRVGIGGGDSPPDQLHSRVEWVLAALIHLLIKLSHSRVGTDDYESPTSLFHSRVVLVVINYLLNRLSQSRVGIGGGDSPPDQTFTLEWVLMIVSHLLSNFTLEWYWRF
ncbi:hypothetical protein J6590_044604 [Homalodisca vitripennis]|nr:hypothetical protein J6590_044604 [Homalodisca vitripennis]